jgi:parvulin-like peptidyl-prolyl isomerase
MDADFRAKQGEDFAALVAEYSDDTQTAKNGGILPPIRPGQTVPEFEDAAFRLRPGEVSDVVESEYGFHVIKRIW